MTHGTDQPYDQHAAAAALHTARDAQAAARSAQRTPRGYVIAQGVACAVEFGAFGLAARYERWSGPLLALGIAGCVAFMALMWAGVRHSGSVPWPRREGRPAWRVLVPPAATIAAGGLAAVPYGLPGALVVFGVVCAVDLGRRVIRTEHA
ncbi:hypothetical protein C3489_02540 [Streptomyces sp. Ru71]|uniref:hypothetical protein n=1 Tax=Streptomyces sp. Ru71 TaxID=2080746 RepID=UPI000CDE1EBB|nr:hypothetical protein [Streptomyces sp. Ru71]POX56693.1 hypothetical protein C3489_02540 [Streptomyces sp. Ru71]